ncbi:MAG: protein-glutamate O-methyltransferase CheR [Bdellovibrio sp.]|nr:protein-glutamate O-methyltransferase CheR [Bdellovibrio sp.]
MVQKDDLDIEIKLLLQAIYDKYSYDFRGYSMSSVKRRMANALTQFRLTSISRIQEKVLHDSSFFYELLQFLTIPTSEMFRDPQFFYQMRENVLPILATYPSLKIWIAGCSTGEEIYSYTILLHEAGLLERTTIYATDINPKSLKRAEQGIFPLDKIKEFTLNYQRSGGTKTFSDYFKTDSNSALFDRSLKKNVVFADHSLATDSVFSEVQLVSCRNVLIYFDQALQKRAFDLFYDSLSRRGFLGLGSKETLRFSEYDLKYDAFAKDEKIYRKK